MRDQIIAEIKRLASANGQAPGQRLFAQETGIAEHSWRGKLWARWGDALVEAGFQPNEWQSRLDSELVLDGIIAAVRHFGRLPTSDEMMIHRQVNPAIPSEQAIKRHFGRRAELVAALARRASDDPAYADLTSLLPSTPIASAPLASDVPRKPIDGHVYLLKSGDFYKIGRSDDLERRVKQIRVAQPEKVTLVHSIRTDDPPGIEAYWHRRFSDRKANGEWFKLTSADIAVFRRRTFQ